MITPIRWGIIGTGNIAGQFARGLAVLPDAELVAVGSRTQESADRFGAEFDITHRHASYEELANDPSVEAVYIATPHPLHKDNSLLCLDAGKAVLCEKPFAMNAAQAVAVINAAREKGLFLMEAMWTRYLPAMVKVRELLAEGVIGEVRMLMADFGFRAEYDPHSRVFDPALGGGALLDVGVYPLSLASMVFGTPERVTGLAHLGETGVDERAAMLFGYPEGQLAILHTALRTTTPQEAVIMGTKGRIKIHAPWWMPSKLRVYQEGQTASRVKTALKARYQLKRRVQTLLGERTIRWIRGRLAGGAGRVIVLPFDGNGYNYEAAEVMRCLRAGELESPVMPLDETLAIMRTMDELREQWGLRYPME